MTDAFHIVVDPALLRPPSGVLRSWTALLARLAEILGAAAVVGSCPDDAKSDSLAAWFDADFDVAASGIARHDLLRIVNEVVGRLQVVLPDRGEVLVDNVETSPCYEPASLTTEHRASVREHLAVVACAKDDGDLTALLFSEHESWAAQAPNVLVEGQIVLRIDPVGNEYEPPEHEGAIRSFIPLCTHVKRVFSELSEFPCTLVLDPNLGVPATWAGKLDGAVDALQFELGPCFMESIERMNYRRNRRYASSCLRAMAMIAGGRAAELAGHDERQGAGGNDPVLCDKLGDTVVRSYLARKTPNAHRIFWINRDPPVFLNVSGHDGGPVL